MNDTNSPLVGRGRGMLNWKHLVIDSALNQLGNVNNPMQPLQCQVSPVSPGGHGQPSPQQYDYSSSLPSPGGPVSPVWSTSSRSRHSSTSSLSEECNCNRGQKLIGCQACGHMLNGRIRTMCVQHPNVIHLMDLEVCPNCRSASLKEYGDSVSDTNDNDNNVTKEENNNDNNMEDVW